jgi:hypothetical protein
MFHKSKPMSFCPLSYSLHAIELTLCYQSIVYAHWQMLLLLNPLEFIWFRVCYFSWGCCDNYGLNKGSSLSQSVQDRHVSPSNYKGFWVSIIIGEHVSSLMCQHDVGSEGHWWPSSFNFTCIL